MAILPDWLGGNIPMRTCRLLLKLFAAPLCFVLASCGSSQPAMPPQDTSEPGSEAAPQDVTITADALPSRAADAASAMNAPVRPAAAPAGDFIRGKGGLEEKCLKAVAKQGVRVTGTNHIEESEAAIGIYVNVEGAEAPWRCLGYKDGTIGEVSFTGDEGAL